MCSVKPHSRSRPWHNHDNHYWGWRGWGVWKRVGSSHAYTIHDRGTSLPAWAQNSHQGSGKSAIWEGLCQACNTWLQGMSRQEASKAVGVDSSMDKKPKGAIGGAVLLGCWAGGRGAHKNVVLQVWVHREGGDAAQAHGAHVVVRPPLGAQGHQGWKHLPRLNQDNYMSDLLSTDSSFSLLPNGGTSYESAMGTVPRFGAPPSQYTPGGGGLHQSKG